MSDEPEANGAVDSATKPSTGRSPKVGTEGGVTYLGSNKRGPGGPLPPIGSQVFFGSKPSSASAKKDEPDGGE